MTEQATRNLHTSAERLPGETFEEYKARRRSFNRKGKDHLKGSTVRAGSTLTPIKKKDGTVLADHKGKPLMNKQNHKPFIGRVKQLIKGQA